MQIIYKYKNISSALRGYKHASSLISRMCSILSMHKFIELSPKLKGYIDNNLKTTSSRSLSDMEERNIRRFIRIFNSIVSILVRIDNSLKSKSGELSVNEIAVEFAMPGYISRAALNQLTQTIKIISSKMPDDEIKLGLKKNGPGKYKLVLAYPGEWKSLNILSLQNAGELIKKRIAEDYYIDKVFINERDEKINKEFAELKETARQKIIKALIIREERVLQRYDARFSEYILKGILYNRYKEYINWGKFETAYILIKNMQVEEAYKLLNQLREDENVLLTLEIIGAILSYGSAQYVALFFLRIIEAAKSGGFGIKQLFDSSELDSRYRWVRRVIAAIRPEEQAEINILSHSAKVLIHIFNKDRNIYDDIVSMVVQDDIELVENYLNILYQIYRADVLCRHKKPEQELLLEDKDDDILVEDKRKLLDQYIKKVRGFQLDIIDEYDGYIDTGVSDDLIKNVKELIEQECLNTAAELVFLRNPVESYGKILKEIDIRINARLFINFGLDKVCLFINLLWNLTRTKREVAVWFTNVLGGIYRLCNMDTEYTNLGISKVRRDLSDNFALNLIAEMVENEDSIYTGSKDSIEQILIKASDSDCKVIDLLVEILDDLAQTFSNYRDSKGFFEHKRLLISDLSAREQRSKRARIRNYINQLYDKDNSKRIMINAVRELARLRAPEGIRAMVKLLSVSEDDMNQELIKALTIMGNLFPVKLINEMKRIDSFDENSKELLITIAKEHRAEIIKQIGSILIDLRKKHMEDYSSGRISWNESIYFSETDRAKYFCSIISKIMGKGYSMITGALLDNNSLPVKKVKMYLFESKKEKLKSIFMMIIMEKGFYIKTKYIALKELLRLNKYKIKPLEKDLINKLSKGMLNRLLIFAIEEHYIKAIDLLIKLGADVNTKTTKGKSILIKAIENNQHKIVELLLQHGSNLNIKSKEGETPLSLAIKGGNMDLAILLLEKKADNNKNRNGETPLMLAVNNKNIQLIEYLFKRGVDINEKDNRGETVFLWAVRSGSRKIIELLLERGADINVRSNSGKTALHMAALMGNIEILQLLIKKGLDINIRDNEGNTILFYAIKHDPDLLDWSLTNAVDINAKTDTGLTPLMLAVKMKKIDVVKLLIKLGIEINTVNNRGETALILAAENDSYEIADMLLKHNAKVDFKSKDGNTALILAAGRGHEKIVKLLISNGAEVNIRNNLGQSPLLLAAKYCRKKLCLYLLDKGADIDIQEEDSKNTLLMYTVMNEWDDIVKQLLKAGVDVNPNNTTGETAAILAKRMWKWEIFEQIESHTK